MLECCGLHACNALHAYMGSMRQQPEAVDVMLMRDALELHGHR